MLRFNFNQQELKELLELYAKCDELNAAIELFKRDNNITGGVNSRDCKEVRELIRVENSITNIQDTAEKRELDYFSTRLDELVSQIRETAEFIMIETANGNADIEISTRWPRMQYVALLSYFQLLQKTPELYQEALQAVNDVFTNRKELISSKRGQEILKKIKAMNKNEQRNFKQDMPKISTKKPKMFVSPNTKVSNKLFARDNSMFYGNEIALAVEGTKSKKQFTTLLSVNYDALSRYKVAFQQLAPFDRTVHDAIVSHYINGENEFISTDMIYRVLVGDDGSSSNTHASPELAAAILDSVKRMASTLVRIDANEQARVYKKGFEALYIGNLLYMEMVEVSMNGQKTGCIHILRKPVLYQYANDFSQVTQTDLKILNVPELINSPENIVLKNYLLQQIRIMKYNAAYSRTIRYDTLYELLNIQAASDASLYNKKRKIRECVKKCLDFWKSEGFIQDYTEETEQHSIAKIVLQVKAEKSSIKALPSKNA